MVIGWLKGGGVLVGVVVMTIAKDAQLRMAACQYFGMGLTFGFGTCNFALASIAANRRLLVVQGRNYSARHSAWAMFIASATLLAVSIPYMAMGLYVVS